MFSKRQHLLGALAVITACMTGCEADSTVDEPTTPPPEGPLPGGDPIEPVDRASPPGDWLDPPMPRPETDEPYVNLSELHYAQATIVGDEHHDPDRDPSEPIDSTPGTVRVLPPPEPPPPAWSSAAGRRLSPVPVTSAADAPKYAPFTTDYPPGLCTTPQPYAGSMSRTLPSGRILKSPLSTFSSESSAVEFLKTVRARFPMYLPFRHPDVRLTSGWFYGNDNSHRGQDYSRKNVPENTDPTFAVHASAAGVVVDAYWANLSGNVVVIEHTAPTGEKYVSFYGHLRNGRTNDVANAKAIDCSETSDERCPLYKTFAEKFSNHLSWGTNEHTLAVKVGDTVRAGQFIGWAGNTGYGGAGWGLEADGSPKNWRGNVHLHTYYGYQHPTAPSTFVVVDPYGVYGKVDDSKCYDLLKDTAFDRLFAPFYPTFHGVPFEIVAHYAGYYTQMGWSPRTLDVHRSSSGLRVSGAFARGIPGSFSARGYLSLTDMQEAIADAKDAGLAPRQVSVTTTPQGEPRYSILFRALEPGESVAALLALDTNGWEDAWSTRVLQQGQRVGDYYAYQVGGVDRFAGVFTNYEAVPFEFYSRRSYATLKSIVKERAKEGYVPVKVTAFERAGGRLYAAMLRKRPGCWRTHYGLTPDAYQLVATVRTSQGYRLEHVQAHGDPVRYTAVFANPDGNPAACGW